MALRFVDRAAEAYDFPLTIRHLLDNVLQSSAASQIVYRDQLRLSYRDLLGRITRLAAVLEDMGSAEGATIAVMDWDSHRYLEAYFAVPMMGNVLQTVNVRLPVDQIRYSLAHAKAEILFVHRDFFELVENILPELPGIRAVVAIADGVVTDLPPYAVGEYEEMLAAARDDYVFRDFDENAVATTFYTSGTTGRPKGVNFTHRQLVVQALSLASQLGALLNPVVGREQAYMPLTPMFHVHAWGTPYVATMLGVKQVYPGRYDFDLVCQLRERERVSYSHCVPTVLQAVLDAAGRRGTDLSGWTMTIGGSALSQVLHDQAVAKGMKILVGYGMSETGPGASLSREYAGKAPVGKTGHAIQATWPIPLVSTRIVDEAMQDVPSDGHSRGELVLRAPWLTASYVDNEAASADLWRGGWLHTQDIATISPDGAILIRDRLKDVIKTGGEWVTSLELEDLVAQVPAVREVAVIGVADARWGERPLAVIVLSNGCNALTLDDVNQPIQSAIDRGLLSRYAKIDRMEIVAELPKTSVGKIDKKAIRSALMGSA